LGGISHGLRLGAGGDGGSQQFTATGKPWSGTRISGAIAQLGTEGAFCVCIQKGPGVRRSPLAFLGKKCLRNQKRGKPWE